MTGSLIYLGITASTERRIVNVIKVGEILASNVDDNAEPSLN